MRVLTFRTATAWAWRAAVVLTSLESADESRGRGGAVVDVVVSTDVRQGHPNSVGARLGDSVGNSQCGWVGCVGGNQCGPCGVASSEGGSIKRRQKVSHGGDVGARWERKRKLV
ncbi:hypothetical protein GUJ93_ZPchr0010g9379 [Zizania palustris]|uniref:Secreted protein n=1 Tax=Zizania palustris TaxID=103762 RepID=A0A8J5TDR1_ZIZPA|nr:hypothetical protein GUJ93_ZPchr0010g9379 [Zizania palustris]